MRSVLVRSAGVGVALAFGAAVVPAHAAQPVVVAVDGTLCDITKTLAGAAASVTCLIPPGGDPHSYRLKPSDRSQIAKSDLVLHIGFGLTPSAKKLKNPGTVVAVGEVALPSYRGSDPHVWHDPANSAAMVRVVSSSLSPVLPASERSALQQRTARAVAVFEALQVWEAKQFGSLPSQNRVLVTDHKTYSHLADRFGLVEISMLDSHTTGGVLRPSSLRKITQEVKSSGAKTIFSPSATPNKTLRRISKNTGLPIATTPLYGEGIAAGRNAVSTATLNVCTIVNGQGGSCDQSGANSLNSQWSSIR
ncbi:zinc ABC transporter substrate-binding protein [Synechococcus sp. HB1133]|uniref:metal ABC transporter substrate-binding protein n=1 Tax=unclassified Synechococcus TaxID=2626047 RepID=UPI000E0FCDB1|nr:MULTISPECIES: metal ABC transporter substrate-binding protein [unclassified Synechococcus]MCB4395292.1 zinc ABC transporter substrate-binding protein [Synechococcus sp. PH41509]MCB4422455.1 zinc ABC transporter substrate-binding protein [Synechococcus sp. HB1133]MCB4430583.1 zinc ABC transporter substrate-binding protein [Synechococcus sp. HBA1120]NHI81403.1 zinc ABC transporter substrate-binding protein [Synechococcus sp. HB1133]